MQKQAIGNMRRRSVRIACRPPRQLVTDLTNKSSDSEAHVQSKKRRLLGAGARARGQLRNVSPKAGCSPESDPQNQTPYSSLKSRTRAACPEKASTTVKVPSGSDSESHSSEDDGSVSTRLIGGISVDKQSKLKRQKSCLSLSCTCFPFISVRTRRSVCLRTEAVEEYPAK